MKIQKSKLIMGGIVLSVVLFIVSYAFVAFGDNEEDTLNSGKIPMPELKGDKQEFSGKLEAIEALGEEREFKAPSVYQEHLMDSLGYYHSDMDSIRKRHLIDSVYALGEKRNEHLKKLKSLRQKPDLARDEKVMVAPEVKDRVEDSREEQKKQDIAAKELALEHQLFFASNPKESAAIGQTDKIIYARVDGTQVVKKDFRLLMRLNKPAQIKGRWYAKNTPIYGFVSFKLNRTLIRIEHIGGESVQLMAFDFSDGSEGIYIENRFRAEAQRQLVGDAVDDINIAGMPQLGGIKQLFRRGNRRVRVTVLDGYVLTLKLKQ